MEPIDLAPSAEGQGDPWDRQDFIDSIDNLCTSHFRSKLCSDQNLPVNNRPKNSTCSTSLSHLLDAPRTVVSPFPYSEEAKVGSTDNLINSNEGFTQLVSRSGRATPFPGIKNPDASPSQKVYGPCKKPQKVWKPKRKHPKLVLGMDVGLSEAVNLALCALVGHLAYK